MTESEDDKLALDMQRGQQARELLANPLFTKVLHDLDAGLINLWRSSTTTENRERAWMGVQILGQLRQSIVGMVSDAEVASQNAADAEARARREALKIVQMKEQIYK